MSVEKIETAVSKLSPPELARFITWFEEFAADEWGRQIEADIRAGLLDAAGKRADEQFAAGRYRPLDLRSDKITTSTEQMTSQDWDDFERHIKEIRTR